MSQSLNLPAGTSLSVNDRRFRVQSAGLLLSRLATLPAGILHRLHERARLRRAARQMLALSDATLRDIGVSRWEIEAAIRLGRPVARCGR